MLTTEETEEKLMATIRAVLRDAGEPDPTLTVKSCPLKDVNGFDSPLGVVVTGLVAIGLGIEIPLDLNVFIDDKKYRLTIEESAALICSIVKKNGAAK